MPAPMQNGAVIFSIICIATPAFAKPGGTVADHNATHEIVAVGSSGLRHINFKSKRHSASFLAVDSIIKDESRAWRGERPKPKRSSLLPHWSENTKTIVIAFGSSIIILGAVTWAYIFLLHTEEVQNKDDNVSARLSVLAVAVNVDGKYKQSGFKGSLAGNCLMALWLVLPILGYILFALLHLANCWDFDPFDLREPEFEWDSCIEPSLVVLSITVFALALSTRFRTGFIVNFMIPCPLWEADVVLVEDESCSKRQVCQVVRRSDGSLPAFDFICFRYIYVEQENRFRPIGHQEISGGLAHDLIARGGLSETSAEELHIRAGPNEINVHVPGIFASICEHFHSLSFIYTLWVVCFFTCCDYVYYAMVLLALAVMSGVAVCLLITRRGKLEVQELARISAQVRAWRNGCVCELEAQKLVPGDLILLTPDTTMPCDCVLVSGGVVMSEAMLTGEPMPITKTPIEKNAQAPRKANLCYSGTKVLDSNGSYEGHALAAVQAIGGATQKASLIRLVLFPTETHYEYDADVKKVYAILILTSCVTGAAFMIIPHPLNSKKDFDPLPVFMRVLGLVCQMINPLMVLAMSAAQAVSATQLISEGISCVAPDRVPLAGCVDTLVLDKTGTITKDGMDFHGVQICQGSTLMDVGSEQSLSDLPLMMRYLMASCHKLSQFGDSYVGNHVEMEMFRALGTWRFDTSKPEGTNRLLTDGTETLEVLRVLDFDHDRMTSGCVCKLPTGEQYIFIKGATNRVESLCVDAPDSFLATSEEWSAKSYYVLACGWKTLGDANVEEATREELENGLTAGGLLLFHNDLKPDSTAALSELRAGGTNCVICTGDHLMTGVNVARTTGIIQPGRRVMCAQINDSTDSSSQEFGADAMRIDLLDVQDDGRIDQRSYPIVNQNDLSMFSDAAIVMGQKEWDVVRKCSFLSTLLPQIVIFGRMLPEGKVAVVEEFQKIGHYVAMCGDGGNDCGGLRAAHVGLALTAAEASIVAPFSSGEDVSLFRMVELLKEGRACMATNLSCYLWFVSYGTMMLFQKSLLILIDDSMWSSPMFFFSDVLCSMVLIGGMLYSRRATSLSPYKVQCSLFSTRIVAAGVGYTAIFALTACFAVWLLVQQPFYVYFDLVAIGIRAHDWSQLAGSFCVIVVFTCSAFFIVIASLTLSLGGHHRLPLWANQRLVMTFLPLMALLLVVLFGRNTIINVVFKANVDTAATLNTFGICLSGPQIIHWGDNASHVQGHVKSIPAMLKESLELQANGLPRCVPKHSTMAEQHIPDKFRSLEAINNIVSHEFQFMLLGTLLALAFFMFLFQSSIVLHPYFDELESRTRITKRHKRLSALPQHTR